VVRVLGIAASAKEVGAFDLAFEQVAVLGHGGAELAKTPLAPGHRLLVPGEWLLLRCFLEERPVVGDATGVQPYL